MAEAQGTGSAAQGLVIAVKRTGKVSRRGVGMPPWKVIVEELNAKT